MQTITLPIAELKPALVGLAKVVHSKSALPVLKHVKVERTSEGWIALTCTDLDRFITMRLEHPAEGPVMSVLIPFEQLLHITKNSSRNERIHIENTNEGPVIKFALADKVGESKVKPIPVNEFPATPRIKADSFPLPPECRRSIHEAMECVSSDSTRRIINGTFIDTSNPKAAYIVGTDGRHLYSANSFALPLKDSVVILPHKFLGWSEFNKDGEWQVKSDAENVQISSRRWRFITRQPQGNYPNWRQVVPEPHTAKTHITIDPAHLEALSQIIERLPSYESEHQTIGLEYEQKQLLLLAKENPTDPWLRIPVSDSKGEGPENGVFLDRRFMLKALSYGLNTISLIDDISPVRFSSPGKFMIAMPVRADNRQEEPKPADVHERPKEPGPPPPAQPPPKPMLGPPSRPPADQAPSIEEAIAMSSTLRDVFLDGADKLRALTVRLRHIQREQKVSVKEMDSFRSRLRSLQGLKL